MKRRVIIIAASIVLLALIVVVGISAQSGKAVATEQTNGNVPESCKGCPSASTCLDANASTSTTCEAKCEHEKSSCDKEKCAKCDKKETCAKSTACATKGCPHKLAADSKKSADCKKDCKKKAN